MNLDSSRSVIRWIKADDQTSKTLFSYSILLTYLSTEYGYPGRNGGRILNFNTQFIKDYRVETIL